MENSFEHWRKMKDAKKFVSYLNKLRQESYEEVINIHAGLSIEQIGCSTLQHRANICLLEDIMQIFTSNEEVSL